MSDPYLDALEQLDQMRDRAFKAEAAIQRVRELRMEVTPNASFNDGYHAALVDVRRALEGDSSE